MWTKIIAGLGTEIKMNININFGINEIQILNNIKNKVKSTRYK